MTDSQHSNTRSLADAGLSAHVTRAPERDLGAWLRHIERAHPQAIALGLQRVRTVAATMRLPHPAAYVISVAGTNGKGSTVAFLEAIARAAGLRVGTYTSPHLLRYNERVRIAGCEANDAELAAAFARVEAARGEVPLTYFEFGTLAALDLFARTELDLAVLEVGLGGRLDAVNLVDADCAIISSVDLDHQDLLGKDREAIGFEKAGILRAGRPAVLAEPDPPASVLRHAARVGAFALRAGCDYHIEKAEAGWRWRKGNETLDLPDPGLAAPAQRANAAAAIAALRALALPIPAAAIAQGVREARIAGRLERHHLAVPGGAIELILDIGHNPQAATQIQQWLANEPTRNTRAVFAALADKDIAGIVSPLRGHIAHWYLAGLDADSPRGLNAATLHARCAVPLGADRCSSASDVAAALAQARTQARPGERLLVFGSFFTVAAALRVLAEEIAADTTGMGGSAQRRL